MNLTFTRLHHPVTAIFYAFNLGLNFGKILFPCLLYIKILCNMKRAKLFTYLRYIPIAWRDYDCASYKQTPFPIPSYLFFLGMLVESMHVAYQVKTCLYLFCEFISRRQRNIKLYMVQ